MSDEETMDRDVKALAAELHINKFRLDDESVKQVSLCLYWNDEYALARTEADKLKVELDRAEADAELKLRREPPQDVKLTEGTVKALVAESPKVRKTQDQLLAAKARVYSFEAATKAIDHRKSELDNLVQLYVKGYYSGTSKDAVTEVSSAVRAGLNRGRAAEEDKE